MKLFWNPKDRVFESLPQISDPDRLQSIDSYDQDEQLLIHSILDFYEDNPFAMRIDIAYKLAIDPTKLTRLIDRLIEDALLERRDNGLFLSGAADARLAGARSSYALRKVSPQPYPPATSRTPKIPLVGIDMRKLNVIPADKVVSACDPRVLPEWQGKDKHGVYFLQETQTAYIKIGVSKSIRSRIASLKTSNPYDCRLVGVIHTSNSGLYYWMEQELHDVFERYRANGEWFKPNHRLFGFIAELQLYDWTLDEVKQRIRSL